MLTETMFKYTTLIAALVAVGCAVPAYAQLNPSLTPRDIVEVADISGVTISPDDRLVAYRVERPLIEQNIYSSEWRVRSLSDAEPTRRLADGGEPLRNYSGHPFNEPAQWSADSRWIYFRAFIDGESKSGRAGTDGRVAERVTSDDADIDGFLVSADGQHLLYAVRATREQIRRAEERDYDNGVRIDRSVPIGQPLFRSGYENGRLATQRLSGSWMARQGLLANIPARVIALNLATLTPRSATSDEEAEYGGSRHGSTVFGNDRWSKAVNPDGGAVELRATGSATEIWGSVDGSPMSRCTRDLCTGLPIEGLAWRNDRPEVIFTVRDRRRGYSQALRAWNVHSGDVREIARSDGLLAGDRLGFGTTCAVGGQMAVCVASEANVPPHLEGIDLDTAERRILDKPNVGLARSQFPQAEYFEWSDAAGRVHSGYLLLPANARRAPLFVTYYACIGYLRGGVGDEWPFVPMATAGLAVLCINQSGAAQGASREDGLNVAMDAVESGIDTLARTEIIDRERVGMGGFSYGSEVALWIAAHSDSLATVSVASTAVSPTYYWFNALRPEFRDNMLRTWQLDAPALSSEAWNRMSPALHSDRIRIPVLMQLSEQEYLPTVEYFIRLHDAGTGSEMFVFPNEPHWKVQPRHRLAAQERNLQWFTTRLLDRPILPAVGETP